jgi:hypothetical protein
MEDIGPMSHANHVLPEFEASWQRATQANFFLEALSAAEFHWFSIRPTRTGSSPSPLTRF